MNAALRSPAPAHPLWPLALLFAFACGAEPSHPAPLPAQPSQSAPKSAAPEPPKPFDISIIGTTDVHGRLNSLPILSAYVNALRQKQPGRVVLIDSGDMFQGTLESNMNEGEAIIVAYNQIGYNAVAIGNHEFDFGAVGDDFSKPKAGAEKPDLRGALKARAAQAKGAFAFLAANIDELGSTPPAWPNTQPSTIVSLEHGLKVGIIGVTTIDTPTTTIAKNVQGISVHPLAKTIEKEAASLRSQGANLIVVAAHAGGNCTQFERPDDLSSCQPDDELFQVARALPPSTVDAIFGGHTHKGVAHRVAGLPLVQAYANGKAFSRIDFRWDPAEKRVLEARIHPPTEIKEGAVYEGKSIELAKPIGESIAPFLNQAQSKRSEEIGITLAEAFPTQYREEAPLGNWITSELLALDSKADAALMNGGGIRTDLPAGPLHYGNLFEVLPFDNFVAKATMSGQNLADLFQKNLSGKHGILSVAGLRVVAACDKGTLSIRLFREGKAKKEIKSTERLSLITNDFLATHGDDGGAYENVQVEYDKPMLRDRIAAQMKKRGGSAKPSDWFNPSAPRIVLPREGISGCKAVSK